MRQVFLSRKDYLAALISFRILLLRFVIVCLFVCFLFIYFLAESDREQKFDVKSRKYSIVLKARGQNLTREND